MKRLLVAGGIIAMVVLIVLIGRRFQREPATVAIIPMDSNQSSEVVVKTPEVKVTVAPIATGTTSKESTTEDKGTEQKIQDDITPKPVETPEVKDKKTKPAPTSTPKPEKETDKKPKDTNSSGGLPGYDNVPDGGENQVTDGDSDGDPDKEVGNMD